MKKKMAKIFLLILTMFSFLSARLLYITNSDTLVEASANQSKLLLDIAQTRGTIYDRDLVPMTNTTGCYVAAVMPCEQSAKALLQAIPVEERANVYKKMEQLTPFVCPVKDKDIYANGIDVFWKPNRYAVNQLAPHIIGSCDSLTGKGASGIECAYDNLLTTTGGSLKIRYTVDGVKRPIGGEPPIVLDTGYLSGAGVVLTLDYDIQRIAAKASRNIQKGAVVVMDCNTGDILASVSCPEFDLNNMSESIERYDAPFINRAFYAYPVGSTFKTLTAATALEKRVSTQRQYTCNGMIKVGDNIFRCHNLGGHGTLDMMQALEKSCNPYFISLALENDLALDILENARKLGFGQACELAPQMFTQSGSLPNEQSFASPAVVANFAFGQGELTATPIQIATLMSAMANGGKAVVPRLVEGATANGKSFLSHTARYQPQRAVSSEAANIVKEMMISVVENGSGTQAKPNVGSAGGKTASAQTGIFENEKEIVHAWFSGFYPAQSPQYAIVVLVEGGESGGDMGAPVFKEIADQIAALK